MTYTPEQHDAIHIHDRNLIVTAGAGSGKTRVLVDRFVALLEAHPEWPLPSLVAVTFTEKAAREMRDRVRQAIEARILLASDSQDDEAIHRWRAHQSALDSARIGTIHSLCATILRANAAYVGIDPLFDVLDEVDAEILRDDAIELALSEMADSPEADNVRWLFAEYDITTIQRTLREAISFPDELVAPLLIDPDVRARGWDAEFKTRAERIVTDLRQDHEFVGALNWRPAGGWPPASDRLVHVWQTVLDLRGVLLADEISADVLNALATCQSAIKLNVGGADAWGGKSGLQESKEALGTIRDKAKAALDEIGGMPDVGEDGVDRRAALLLPGWGMAIAHTQEVYRSLKAKRGALDFDDLEALTRRLLQNDEIAARYRAAEFQHILVDEFQDTNGAQRDILYALAGLDRTGSLFVVGDPKQSIYQFRGADVSIFEQVRGQILTSGGHEILLNTSFRTHDRLVGGFNAIFANLLQRGSGAMRDYEVEYGEPLIAYRPAEPHHSPSLEVIVIDKQKADPDRNDMETLRRWEASALATRLQELVTGAYPVWDKAAGTYRPVNYGDIAILFRSSTSMPVVEDVFKAVQVPYITIAGKGYFNRPEVWDLLNLLKALYNVEDNLALAAALRSPLFNLSDEELLALRLQYGRAQSGGRAPRLSLWTALTQRDVNNYNPPPPRLERIVFAREALKQLHGVAGRITIAELLTRVVEATAFLATLAGLPDGARRVGNVEKLIELARKRGSLSLGEFTTYLQDLTDREAREGESLVATGEAVQLMTVHKSKGLEFPVVALFDAAWSYSPPPPLLLLDPVAGPACKVRDETTDPPGWAEPFAFRLAKQYRQERADAESLRLLYVGMTRAQDYLIVSGNMGSKGSREGSWLNRLMTTLELSASLENPAHEVQQIVRPWGTFLVRIPAQPIDLAEAQAEPDNTPGGWAYLSDPSLNLDASASSPVVPPLLQPVPIDPQSPARLLSVTEIAKLGEAQAIPDAEKFRHHILRGAPTSVREVANPDVSPRVTGRIIGDVVHQALRWWHLPGNTPNLRDVLRSYAWAQGVTDPVMLESAIEESYRLLEDTEQSPMVGKILAASQVYRELPFALKWGGRTINGVIDVLYFSKFNRWAVVDYKTSTIRREEGDTRSLPERIADHARRYYGQVGIYAMAVEQLTGQPTDTFLHYVRHVFTLEVAREAWQPVLDTLDADIAAMLKDDAAPE